MELYQIVTSIMLPIGISVFLWIERRSIMNIIADFRLEKDSQGKEVSEEQILNKMKKIMGYHNADRP